jgi:hypothetical protein
MSEDVSYDTLGAMLHVHAMVCGCVLEVVGGIPEARMTEQPRPLVNHPAWTLSHLNAYAGMLLALLDDRSVPTADTEMKRFGFGTTPVPDPSVYAPKGELLEQFRVRNERLATVVRESHGRLFPRPAPERYHPHAPTIGHIAITLLVTHPADHLGQLRLWRRVAGIADKA